MAEPFPLYRTLSTNYSLKAVEELSKSYLAYGEGQIRAFQKVETPAKNNQTRGDQFRPRQ